MGPLEYSARTAAAGASGPENRLRRDAMVKMTSHDYHVVMKKVGIADLKARLSEHIRYVRAGHEVTVLDRETPVARIVPVAQSGALRVRLPRGETLFAAVPMPEEAVDLGFDVVELLLEDRDPDR